MCAPCSKLWFELARKAIEPAEQREEVWLPKVGDRVRVKANCSARGLLGEVSHVNGAAVRVRLDERQVTHVFVSSDVEPASPTPPPSEGVDVPRALELANQLVADNYGAHVTYVARCIVTALTSNTGSPR